MKAKALIPLVLFLLLAGLFFFTLKKINQGEYNPRHVPSPFIGKQAPAFSIPDLLQPGKKVDPAAMRGKVWLMNVWGTWCPECWREHGYLLHLAKDKGVNIVGVDWRDDPAKGREMIAKLGNPFLMIADDQAGNVAIDWGVYGAPETFVVDKQGIIRLKYEGAINEDVWRERFEPLVRQLEGQP
ncbi:MAG: hypothetical protein A2286_04310 [Gammaproteobacteria bacterium RIFOXYA12_FULL_61_12]|nr:MAG: hypothetical protein A2514_09550 [Gammaproteobacteria bacterium RIFOXYD12_FULL_61_37]OGT93620.1 MAG: hypothetical protein A2286_04310 [Gammaproteobacteria bacterium RIFOXYA12_FULL_61_12]